MRRRKRTGRVYGRYLAAIFIWLLLITGLAHMVTREEGGFGGTDTESRLDVPDGKLPEPTSGSSIRVLLMTTGYSGEIHSEVRVSSDAGLRVSCGGESIEWNRADTYQILPDDARFQKGNIRVEPLEEGGQMRLESIERGCGTPSYAGTLELRAVSGGMAVINELPVETYLCGVVPSEMPASYELEALKAQAVCARSYAFRQMTSYGYPEYEAHVNDSTDFQVYNNSERQENSTRAVAETEGQVVRYKGEIATTYYYSTSCGRTTSLEAWGTDPGDSGGYLQSVEVRGDSGDYEKDLPWYRWTAQVPVQTLSALVSANTGVSVGTLSSVEVTKRGPGDVALQIVASGDAGSVTVDTENKIRGALGGSGYTITKNDGSTSQSTALLPSAFFTIEKSGDTFVISGGGFGHGIGMSQNGANEMAKQGADYREILQMFYKDVEIS
ncbi:SpoIID/LytB domain-containing protein [Lachnoclostridium sp. An118]|uniref:SpoIID/LytB domain-containing protein n=1 Tax=Lachnoclostridium sp. An118 TaxID=1965547 RepID=UPI001FA91CEF|nr:SpoIID/LytB domain-containing protein [Lachnoclostridium sp. An118]